MFHNLSNSAILCLWLCSLVVLGCGDDVEEGDANVLEPGEDLRFQELPVADERGSLIPPDEVPVVTIEKTREDAENVWWRLKANPVPARADLVVHVIGPTTKFPRKHSDAIFLSILKFENSSVEWESSRSQEEYTVLINPVRFDYRQVIHSFWDLINDPVPQISKPSVLDDGYVVPPVFHFHFYRIGEPSELKIPAQE